MTKVASGVECEGIVYQIRLRSVDWEIDNLPKPGDEGVCQEICTGCTGRYRVLSINNLTIKSQRPILSAGRIAPIDPLGPGN